MTDLQQMFKNRFVRVTMPDGSRWDVPVMHIALARARYYAHEYGDSVGTSLEQDTEPLFVDESEILDWAQNDMNWSDVKDVAERAPNSPVEIDWENGWVSGPKEIVTKN